jgi:uncharacterized membrane protein YgcG
MKRGNLVLSLFLISILFISGCESQMSPVGIFNNGEEITTEVVGSDVFIDWNSPGEGFLYDPHSSSWNPPYANYLPYYFTFDQSITQAFYFFDHVTINGINLVEGDWVSAFNGDISIGTHYVGGSVGVDVTVPAMGDMTYWFLDSEYDFLELINLTEEELEELIGDTYTFGYLQSGQYPTFRIYDSSEELYYEAIHEGSCPGFNNLMLCLVDSLYSTGNIYGCTNNQYTNYNHLATLDDGSCLNYYFNLYRFTFDEEYEQIISGLTDSEYIDIEVLEGAIFESNCYFVEIVYEDGQSEFYESSCIVYNGCTSNDACNYSPYATEDDGSCFFPFINSCGSDTGSCVYGLLDCGGNCIGEVVPTEEICNGLDDDCDGVNDQGCDCIDPNACNYESDAIEDDGSCWYSELNQDCDGNCLNDEDEDGVCNEEEIVGCSYDTACNYDFDATDDDGSCEYAEENYDCDGNCIDLYPPNGFCDHLEVYGCTYLGSENYNPDATIEDGSCIIPTFLEDESSSDESSCYEYFYGCDESSCDYPACYEYFCGCDESSSGGSSSGGSSSGGSSSGGSSSGGSSSGGSSSGGSSSENYQEELIIQIEYEQELFQNLVEDQLLDEDLSFEEALPSSNNMVYLLITLFLLIILFYYFINYAKNRFN